MLAGLQLKLLLTALCVSLIAGAYFYTRHLSNKVDKLEGEKIELQIENKGLTKTLEEQNRINDIVNRVTEIGNAERQVNRSEYESKKQRIDSSVKKGEDKPVGPLLKDFFNAE